MSYSISEFGQKVGLTPHTLRYYEKEGLLPFVHRSSSGLRVFTEKDIEWLVIITCLKNTGMSVKQIKVFIDWCMAGDSTLEQRYHFFVDHKKVVQAQIKKLEACMDKINYKIEYYRKALIQTTSERQAHERTCLEMEKKKLIGE